MSTDNTKVLGYIVDYCNSIGWSVPPDTCTISSKEYIEFLEKLPTHLVRNLRKAGAIVTEYSRFKHRKGIVESTLVAF
jgi:phosphatidylserine/phosphatidylglycerophosphate/cardiolipin synthase-like enzyme